MNPPSFDLVIISNPAQFDHCLPDLSNNAVLTDIVRGIGLRSNWRGRLANRAAPLKGVRTLK